MKSGPKYVHTVKDIPTTPHFAVVMEDSITYDDGYGDHHTPSYSKLQYLNYLMFDTVEQVQEWAKTQDFSKNTFRVLEVRPCTVTREVHIGIS